LYLVLFENLLAGLDHEIAVPVVNAQQNALPGFEVPARIEPVVVWSSGHMLEIWEELVGGPDLHEGRAARRTSADAGRRRIFRRCRSRKSQRIWPFLHTCSSSSCVEASAASRRYHMAFHDVCQSGRERSNHRRVRSAP